MKDLWGNEIVEPVVVMVRNGKGRKCLRKGFAAVPGTGPVGETCRTCKHAVGNRMAKTYWKCALMRRFWTGGFGTDIVLKSPACSRWSKKGEA